MTFQELITPVNLSWPPVAYTILVVGYITLSRKYRGLDLQLHPGHVLRIFIQGVILEAVFLVVVFVDPALIAS